MPSVMAIVSKAIFEKEARGLGPGDVWTTARYASQNKALAPVGDGGDLYLVTVRPPESLWLVGVLRAPRLAKGEWRAAPNIVPIRAIDDVRSALRFATGAGIQARPGALGMSLQTPRVLADEDVARMGAKPSKATAKLAKATAKPAKATPKPAKATPKPAKATPKPAKATEAKLDRAAGRAAAGGLDELTRTLDHLRADRPGAALVQAIAAWRELRAPELAALVTAIGVHVDRSMRPITGSDKKAVQRAWLDLAVERRAVDLGRLLATLDQAALPSIRARYELLGAFAPDPRLVAPMLAIPPNYSYEAGPCFKHAFDLAEQSGDPALRPVLDRMVRKTLVPAKGDSSAWRDYLAKHARRAAKIRDALPRSVPVPPAVLAQLAACDQACTKLGAPSHSETELIAESHGAPTVDHVLVDLLAAVLRDPADDQARAIYADALEQRGDPRGELISLQLEAARTGKLSSAAEARVRALLKAHGRAWIAPLDAAIRPDSIRFERGFLDACAVAWKTDTQRAALCHHPLWATVTEIDAEDEAFLLQDDLRSLRRAELGPRALAKLAARRTPAPLEAVRGNLVMSYGVRTRLGIGAETAQAWGKALDIGALVNLRSLQLGIRARRSNLKPASLRWLLDSKLGHQLRELELVAWRDVFVVAPWVEVVRGRDDLVVRGTISNGNTASGSRNMVVTFELARRGGEVDVTMSCNDEMADLRYFTITRQLEESLAKLPSKHARAVTVRYVGSGKRKTTGFPAIAKLLDQKFASVTLE